MEQQSCTLRQSILLSPQGSDGHIDNIVSEIIFFARPGIKLVGVCRRPSISLFVVIIQVNREKEQPPRIMAVPDDFFSAVSMMDVKIDYGATFAKVALIRDRMKCSCSNVVENAESTRFASGKEPFDASVMARRPDNAKRISVATDEDTATENVSLMSKARNTNTFT